MSISAELRVDAGASGGVHSYANVEIQRSCGGADKGLHVPGGLVISRRGGDGGSGGSDGVCGGCRGLRVLGGGELST